MAVIFMAANLCLHLLVSTNYELHRDEMLYFNIGSHPAFGYLTVPPLTGLLAFLVQHIFGYSVFGIRLIPAIFSTATLFVVAFLLVLPNIIWQFNHNWPVLYHFEELKKTQISNLKYTDFFCDLFSLNSALILVWLRSWHCE